MGTLSRHYRFCARLHKAIFAPCTHSRRTPALEVGLPPPRSHRGGGGRRLQRRVRRTPPAAGATAVPARRAPRLAADAPDARRAARMPALSRRHAPRGRARRGGARLRL